MKHLNLLFFSLFLSVICHAKVLSDTVSFNVYPNPSTGHFSLIINSPVAQKMGIDIAALTGAVVYRDSITLTKGFNSFAFDLRNQPSGVYFLMLKGAAKTQAAKIVVISDGLSRSDSLDILHYDLSLQIRNLATKTISGTTTVRMISMVNGLQKLSLDLLKLQVSAVEINAVSQAFSQTDSTLFIELTTAQQTGDTFEVAITYSGQPVTDGQWGGFYFSGNYAYNMGVGFQSNPHNFGRCWFPCADNFTDRATYTFHITTDPSFKAVCNGLMLPETPNMDGSTTWNWEIRQPIPTYLASVAVGQYEFIRYEFGGSTRTYPVWIAVVAADTTKAKASFAKLNNALQCFEQKYGPYPFDRVGYVGVPFNAGAMEHATNIAYPNYAINGGTNYETLFAHELSHMWWGDLATCRTAEDMWLNEGWASFNEALFLECVYGKQAYLDDLRSKSVEVLLSAPKTDGAWLPVSGVPHNATYGTHVYKKGALMVHTLRSLMGDSAFFAATQSYLAHHQYTDVSTDDLIGSFQSVTGIDLFPFFQKWIFSAGHSDITVGGYTQTGNTYHFDLIELSRINSYLTPRLPFTFTVYYNNGSSSNRSLLLQNGYAVFDTTLPQGVSVADWEINADFQVQLAHIMQKQAVSTTGNLAFANALSAVNIQTAGAPGDSLIITHHWVGPTAPGIRKKGIQPSSERYWTVSGKLSQGFKAWGFFNYDGIPGNFLDNELIQQTEDSLVLLYRANPDAEWTIHTDNTFQPGTSKTDKTGRFWVNDLQKGEYTFGMRNKAVVGLKEIPAQSETTFLIAPNPADTENDITLLFNRKVYVKKVTIHDMKGNTIKIFPVAEIIGQIPFQVSGMPSGHYIITVETDEMVLSRQWAKTK